jgi:hypothetical protein
MKFVYGTGGNAAENAWALAKARYDAETFWYRGNGSVDVVADIDFLKQTKEIKDKDRSVVLYGNADTNKAYSSMLPNSPMKVDRTRVTVGSEVYSGDDLACMFVQPRPGSATAYVAVVGGTGLPGNRLSERIPIFLSGADFPDYIVYGSDALTKGAAGVRAAGFFNNNWGK